MFWLISAIISCLSFGIQSSVNYYFSNKKKLGSAAVNTVYHTIFILVAIIFIIIGFFFSRSYIGKIVTDFGKICSSYLLLGLSAGISGLIANCLIYEAYTKGSDINPGVITGISNGAIIVSVFLAFIFYGKKISIKQIIGIIVLLFSFSMLGDDDFPGFRKFFFEKKK